MELLEFGLRQRAYLGTTVHGHSARSSVRVSFRVCTDRSTGAVRGTVTLRTTVALRSTVTLRNTVRLTARCTGTLRTTVALRNRRSPHDANATAGSTIPGSA